MDTDERYDELDTKLKASTLMYWCVTAFLTLLLIVHVFNKNAHAQEPINLTLTGQTHTYHDALPASPTPVWAVVQDGDTLTGTVALDNPVLKDDWMVRVVFGNSQWGPTGVINGGAYIEGSNPGEWFVIPSGTMPGQVLFSFGILNGPFAVALPRPVPDLAVELWSLLDSQGANIALDPQGQVVPGPHLHAAAISAECEAFIPTAEALIGPRPDINAYPCQDASGTAIWGDPLSCQGSLGDGVPGVDTADVTMVFASDFFNVPVHPHCVPNSCGAGPLDRPCF